MLQFAILHHVYFIDHKSFWCLGVLLCTPDYVTAVTVHVVASLLLSITN